MDQRQICRQHRVRPNRAWQNGSLGAHAMRSFSALGLSIGLLFVLCASADAAPQRHPSARQPVVTRPPADAAPPRARFAVPGWSDESTRRWLDDASSSVGTGG